MEQVFAYPGDGINGILGAFGRADNSPAFVQSRHEEMSAFEAVGYAKLSGRPGVCLATSGPGAIHLLNGLYDAKLDHVPVVAIVGQTNRSAMGGSYQQEVDLLSLFKDVASDYLQMVTVPEQLPNVLDRALRTATARRAPTALIIPNDVQELEYTPPTYEFKMVPSSLGTDWPRVVGDDSAIGRVAELLNAGSKVAMLIGQGARGAHAEVEQVADLLGAGVAKALLGKDVLSDEPPFVTGSIGLLGNPAGRVTVRPRKWNPIGVGFCSMKTIISTSSTSAEPTATQAALARVNSDLPRPDVVSERGDLACGAGVRTKPGRSLLPAFTGGIAQCASGGLLSDDH